MAAIPGWQRAVLKAVGAPATPTNVRFLDLWQRAEGGAAAANPLNTTQPAAGATDYNSVHVRNYPDAATGIRATAQTLLNGRYGPIVEGLRGGASLVDLARAVAASPWGTGAGVLRLLGEPVPAGGAAAAAAPVKLDGAAAPAQGGGLSPLLARVFDANNQLVGIPSIDIAALAPAAAPIPPASVHTSAAAAPASVASGAIAELIREGTGGPTHSTGPHLHFASTNAQAMLAAIQHAQAIGLAARENPYVEHVDPVHAPNSFHYRRFPGLYSGRPLGEATDFSGDPSLVNALYQWIQTHYGA